MHKLTSECAWQSNMEWICALHTIWEWYLSIKSEFCYISSLTVARKIKYSLKMWKGNQHYLQMKTMAFSSETPGIHAEGFCWLPIWIRQQRPNQGTWWNKVLGFACFQGTMRNIFSIISGINEKKNSIYLNIIFNVTCHI